MTTIAASGAMREADYTRAIELWPGHVLDLVRNAHIVPHWFGREDRFWFKDEHQGGHRFLVVDAPTGESRPAFDHERVAQALRSVEVPADAAALPITSFEFVDGGAALVATTAKGNFRIDPVDASATPAPRANPAELAGPDGRVLFLRGHNLWVRDSAGEERALTTDGEAHFAWGHGPDFNMRRVAENRGQVPPLPTGLHWSDDGRLILAERADERGVEPYPYVEYVPADGSVRPKLHLIRHTMLGEAPPPHAFALIDSHSGARTPIGPLTDGLKLRPDVGALWWSADGRHAHTVATSFDARRAAFVEIELASGAARVIHQEVVDSFFDFNSYLYNRANVRMRANGREAIWFSERSGWGHLYLLDLRTGAVRALTEGAWAVNDIIGMTEDRVFFTAGGREPGRHPYYRHLYRVDLDGSGGPNAGLTLLTSDDADHGFSGEPTPAVVRSLNRPAGLRPISPSARYFLDTVTRVDLPARFIVRDAEDGRAIREIARTDASALEAAGWRPPEIFSAKAADGVTELYGVLVKPRDFDPQRSYPVIEHIYGGPQIVAQPRTFLDGINGSFLYGMNTLADLGFIVAVLDGPGTPSRSKAFHDMTYGQADRWGTAHHRAALEGAAASRPWMDLSRVGVRGHSFGGYGTAAALLLEPDFYKVGVSSAGMYDVAWAYAGLENYFGRPAYEADRFVKTRPDEVAPKHQAMSPSRMAGRLAGQLLLAGGDLDENIQPAGLFHFANALIAAGKSFDLLMLPGRNHGFSAEAYFHKRTWDYFIEHLQGRQPLKHFTPKMKPGVRMFI
ncbi:DPP IV N-terminal domain-containing protein [Pelomonas sp. KK5]|uniref:S9 family peptidase n=1 Tax=Pelomonas sp. KK5 TaxID=1855730 RepID=UPI001301FCE5|nr:DPP IV N-terminal domain-containing protein [Pelomonas sp. KK5]